MQRIKKTYRSKTVYLVRKMYQTEKYKLNLIEPSDPFLPDGLNANTQRIEDVLAEKMEGPVVDLDARVTALEARKFAFGHYIGDNPESGGEQFIYLGFTPKAAIISMRSSSVVYYMADCEGGESGFRAAEDGFYAIYPMNTSGHWYYYYVFG